MISFCQRTGWLASRFSAGHFPVLHLVEQEGQQPAVAPVGDENIRVVFQQRGGSERINKRRPGERRVWLSGPSAGSARAPSRAGSTSRASSITRRGGRSGIKSEAVEHLNGLDAVLRVGALGSHSASGRRRTG